MKIPTSNIDKMKLYDDLQIAFGFSQEYRASSRRDKVAQGRWDSSDQQFIKASSFALNARGVPNRPGVYAYAYKPTGEHYYIGQSENMRSRVGSAISYFKTFAKTGVRPTQTGIPGVDKMLAMDPELKNWEIHFMETYGEHIAIEQEIKIIYEENPKFNNKGQAGK